MVNEMVNEININKHDAHKALVQAMCDVELARTNLKTKHGRDPNAPPLAKHLGMSEDKVLIMQYQSSVEANAKHKTRFEFEDFPLPPMPAPAELPLVPPPPLNKLTPQLQSQCLSQTQLALLPRVSILSLIHI